MKRWRLGLDVGTASVGAVAIELDANGRPAGVPWHHVRIFAEPNEKSQTGLTPKKAGRRQARQQRRQLERRARRVRKVAHLAPLIGLDQRAIPSDGRKGQHLPGLRAQAARERIELDDLLRVLLRMAKRRGYAGGFRGASDDKELGVVQSGSSGLQREMLDLAQRRGLSCITLGEFLAERVVRGLPTRLKVDRQDIPNLYALREMLQAEFEQIWSTQAQFHPALQAINNDRPVKEIFWEAIFHQRPLKSPATTVGLCPLERFLPRAPRAQMAAQDFRIEKTLADLRWGAGRLAQALTADQRAVIRTALNTPARLTKDGKLSFKKIYKLLDDSGVAAPVGRSLNIDRASRDELVGNTTLKAFEKLGLAEAWAALDSGHQTSIINLLADLGSPQQLDPDDWHQRFLKAGARPGDRNRYRVFHPEVIRFVDQLRNAEGFDRLTKMGFDGGRMAYSVKALNRLIEWLLHPHWRASPGVDSRVDEEAAIRECYPDAGQPGGIPGTLSAPARTGNDTVDVALAQVRWVIADALLNLGSAPSEIIVEFGREVGLGPARRNEWEKFSAKNQRLRNSAKAEITANGGAGTNTQIRRYLLWQEQGTHCPYCGSPLGLAEVLDGSQSHIEHIIPRSLTQVGRKRSEIVIAHASCNNQKGDRTPWQAFGHDEQRWTIIEERASALKKNNKFRKAKLLLLKDFEREVLNDQSIADFADRQLHQTSWIARAACQWLTQLCSNVFAARGEFTALLRRSWHLDTVIPEIRLEHGLSVLDIDGKSVTAEEFANYRRAWEGHGRAPGRILDKRLDHRHHAIDALVIGLADRSIYQKLARNYKQSLAEGPTAGHRHEWQAEPPLANVREQAKEMIDTCRLTHKPDRFPAGALFQETAYSLKVNREDNSASLASREVLSGLLDEKSPEKTRKNLASIASVEVREFVLAEFERRIASGETPKQALSRPVQYPRYRTQIWRVRRMRSDVSAAKARPVIFSSRAGEHSKLLLPDGNAYLEVKGAGRGATVRVVSLAEAATAADVEPSMEVRRFFKGDTVIDGDDGSTLIVKQVVAPTDGQPMLRLVPIFETREWAALRARDGRRQIAGAQLIRLIHADVCTSSVAAGRLSPPRN